MKLSFTDQDFTALHSDAVCRSRHRDKNKLAGVYIGWGGTRGGNGSPLCKVDGDNFWTVGATQETWMKYSKGWGWRRGGNGCPLCKVEGLGNLGEVF